MPVRAVKGCTEAGARGWRGAVLEVGGEWAEARVTPGRPICMAGLAHSGWP
jgi:hypothetical protein